MSFLSRLFGSRHGPGGQRVTPQQLAKALFEAALERMRSLHAALDDSGLLAQMPGATSSKEYALALMVFTLAPLDQVLSDLPMPHMRKVRAGVRSLFGEQFRLKETAETARLLDLQLKTYARAARTGDLPALGHLAAVALGLEGEADAEHHLLSNYTSALNAWLTMIEGYQVLGSPASALSTTASSRSHPPKASKPKGFILSGETLRPLNKADLDSLSLWFGNMALELQGAYPLSHEFMSTITALLIHVAQGRHKGQADPPQLGWDNSMVHDMDEAERIALGALVRGKAHDAAREGHHSAGSFLSALLPALEL